MIFSSWLCSVLIWHFYSLCWSLKATRVATADLQTTPRLDGHFLSVPSKENPSEFSRHSITPRKHFLTIWSIQFRYNWSPPTQYCAGGKGVRSTYMRTRLLTLIGCYWPGGGSSVFLQMAVEPLGAPRGVWSFPHIIFVLFFYCKNIVTVLTNK